ncbi:MAG: hypothetical protein ACKVY0_12740 [Prosthecobacter sp.]|uniref:hypothetical protein n=1 Tax=Prosthecobacter sp. TaxID=1965333 RepID=UPI0039030D79
MAKPNALTRSKLWQWLVRGEDGTVMSFLLLILGIALGAVAMIAMLGIALTARASSNVLPMIAFIILGSPVIWGFIVGAIQPRQALLWSASFSLPMLVWGLFCLLFVLFEGPGLLIWLLAAFAMAALCILGSLLACRLRR